MTAKEFAEKNLGALVTTSGHMATGREGVVVGWAVALDGGEYVLVDGSIGYCSRGQVEEHAKSIDWMVPGDGSKTSYAGLLAGNIILLSSPKPQLDMSAYPHTCYCGARAYRGGVTALECSAEGCRYFKPAYKTPQAARV